MTKSYATFGLGHGHPSTSPSASSAPDEPAPEHEYTVDDASHATSATPSFRSFSAPSAPLTQASSSDRGRVVHLSGTSLAVSSGGAGNFVVVNIPETQEQVSPVPKHSIMSVP